MSQNLFAGRIEDIQLEDEIQSSYLDYAMSVIVGRALPDVRDGLKPVHKRILFALLAILFPLPHHSHTNRFQAFLLRLCLLRMPPL